MERRRSSSSSSKRERELFRGGGAELYLIVEGEDQSVMMEKGEFVLLLVKHARSPLAAVVAMVGDMQWPVGKDSLVFKGKANCYFFSLPASLTFALAFNPLGPDSTVHLQRLDCLLHQYSTFLQQQQPGTAEMVHEASEFWTRIARNAESDESILHAMLHTSGPFSIGNLESMSPKLAQKMQQARRMSAVEKLFARSVETGVINASTHVKMPEADASDIEFVFASVDAVVKVVEAVETAGKTLLENTQTTSRIQKMYGNQECKLRAVEGLDAAGSLITSAWTLNKMGLCMLFRTIASIHSKSNMSRSDSRSLWSMDVNGRLCVSSSGSFSSISSKSPSELPSLVADITSPSQVASPPQVDALSRLSRTDSTTPAQAGVSSIVDMTCGQPGNGNAAVPQGVFWPPPLPPRFNGAALRPPGVIQAGSVAVAAPRGTEPSGFRVYKPQPSVPQAAMSNALSHVPRPLRPPPRPHHRSI